jgi:hypothetical protein
MIPRSLSPYLFDDWFDPIEACVRERVREVIGRFNVGRFEVEHPGDYATFKIPTNSATGPWFECYCRIDPLFCALWPAVAAAAPTRWNLPDDNKETIG